MSTSNAAQLKKKTHTKDTQRNEKKKNTNTQPVTSQDQSKCWLLAGFWPKLALIGSPHTTTHTICELSKPNLPSSECL